MKVCFQQLAGWSSGSTVKWGIKMGVQAVQKNSLQVKERKKKKNACNPTVALRGPF